MTHIHCCTQSHCCDAIYSPEPGCWPHACFMFAPFTVLHNAAIPLMPFHWIHLPQAKKADTMNPHSRRLIISMCLLLNMTATLACIYKTLQRKNILKSRRIPRINTVEKWNRSCCPKRARVGQNGHMEFQANVLSPWITPRGINDVRQLYGVGFCVAEG